MSRLSLYKPGVAVKGLLFSLVAGAFALGGLATFTNAFTDVTAPLCPHVAPVPMPVTLADQFETFELGYRVSGLASELHQDYRPLDLDSDGIVELGIVTAGSPVKLGVYSPLLRDWLMTPIAIPVSGLQWGIADYDRDGSLDIAYQKDNAVRLYRTSDATDSLLWQVPETHRGTAAFWGATPEGKDLVGFGRSNNTYLYEVFGGAFVRSFGVSNGFDVFVTDYPQPGQICFASLRTNDNVVTVLDHTWNIAAAFAIPDVHMDPPIPDPPALVHFAVSPPIPASPRFFIANVMGFYGVRPTYLYGYTEGDYRVAWSAATTLRKGIAGFDIYGGGGVPKWISVLGQQEKLWEFRSISNGTIKSHMAGMPTGNIHTAPLLESGRPNLYYISGDNLYIWRRGTALGENDPPTNGETTELVASPNPFNASCTIQWTDQEPRSLEIIDVLGRRVRTFPVRAIFNQSEVTWDGRDDRSNKVASGIYFARLVTTRGASTVKLVLLK